MTIDSGLVAAQLLAPETKPRIALLLGAGCSMSSGVPLAGEILSRAKAQIFEARTGRETVDQDEVERWAIEEGLLQNPATAYGEALELLRPTPQGRRLWLSQYFKDRQPAAAYDAMADLVRDGTLKALYSTNFDDLAERAIGNQTRVRVVANNQAAGEVEFPPQTPTLFKLHGDYLFDGIANTATEVTDLPAAQKQKLELALRSGGMIVIGYGGGDESIMSVLESVEDIPLGLYWMHVSPEPPERVQRLIQSRSWAYSSRVAGFDEWIAEVVVRQRPRPGDVEPSSTPPPNFVAHERLGSVRDDLSRHLLEGGDPAVVVSGMPGRGKTALAQIVATGKDVRGRFERRVEISADNRAVGLAELLEELWNGLDGGPPPSQEHVRTAVLERLYHHSTLIVLDNIDSLDDDVIELLRDVPNPSRALVTIRDVGRLRGLDIPFTEIEHPGLDDGEMRELADQLAQRSPLLQRHLASLTDGELEDAITRLQGWPQALKLLLAQLEDPTTSEKLNELLDAPDLYRALLSGAVEALPEDARRLMRAGGAFPATFTLAGARTTARQSEATGSNALRVLISRQMASERGNGIFAFAHPLISSYARELVASRKATKARARNYLSGVIEANGGQPLADWSNFKALDLEFENVREIVDDALSEQGFAELTRMFSRLFPYFVERGHWFYTESVCERVLATGPAATWAAEWWVWRSWIAYYLRKDSAASADAAQAALATGTRRRWTRFQAHRRAVTAYAALGSWERVTEHRAAASEVAKAYAPRSEEQIDLLNTVGLALIHEGGVKEDTSLLRESLAALSDAEARNEARADVNTRELNVSRIGRARALKILGTDLEEAMSLATQASQDAWRLRWLRGIVEANDLVAELAEAAGDKNSAVSARNVADSMRVELLGAA